MIQNPHIITTAFHIFPKGHYRATVHGDVTHAPSESCFWNSTLVDFYYSLDDSPRFNSNPYFELFNVSKGSTSRVPQMENNVMLLCIPLFPWILVIGLEFMMTSIKIKTEDHDWDKQNSLGNLATHEKVLFVLSPNNFLTKKWIQFHFLCLFDATGTVHVIPSLSGV